MQKLGEQRIDPALGRRSFRRFNNGPALRHDCEAAGCNVKLGAAVWRKCAVAELVIQAGCEAVGTFGVAVIDENKLRLFGEALEPCDQSLLVGVAADTRKRSDLGLDLDLLVEELYFL